MSLTELNTRTERRAHEPVPRHERTRALSRTGCNTVYTAVSGPRCANMREISAGIALRSLRRLLRCACARPRVLNPGERNSCARVFGL